MSLLSKVLIRFSKPNGGAVQTFGGLLTLTAGVPDELLRELFKSPNGSEVEVVRDLEAPAGETEAPLSPLVTVPVVVRCKASFGGASGGYAAIVALDIPLGVSDETLAAAFVRFGGSDFQVERFDAAETRDATFLAAATFPRKEEPAAEPKPKGPGQ